MLCSSSKVCVRALVIGGLSALLTVACFQGATSIDQTCDPHADPCGADPSKPALGDAAIGPATNDTFPALAASNATEADGGQSATHATEAVATPAPTLGSSATSSSAPIAITLPEGCAGSSEFGEWVLFFRCEEQPYTVSCSPLEPGWHCACSTEFANYTSETKSYQIETESAEQAASLTALTCLGDDPEVTAAPEECATEEQADSGACTLTEVCRRATEVNGVKVTYEDQGNRYTCNRESSGLAACRCGDWVWKFPDVELQAGCGFVRAFCESETRTPVGEHNCNVGNAETTEDSCALNEQCEHDFELGDGSLATVVLSDSVSCNAFTSERPFCYCNDDEGRLQQFEHSSVPLTLDKCREAKAVCRQMPEHERTGPYECEVATRSAAGTRCDSRLTCRQPATVGETSIDLLGTLTTQCNSTSDSAWQCSCTSTGADGVASSAADVTISADDVTSACVTAEARCLDEVEVVFASGLPGR